MELRELGRTGVSVSPLCLGAMMFGAWGNTDHDESIRIIHHALDAGINFVDTADVYARGESEEIVGKALKGRRDSVVLATKVHGVMHDTDPNQRGNSRRWIVQEVEASLRRLQTDWIDLYQIHRWDPWIDARGDARRADGSPAGREDPLPRLVDLPAVGDRRGAVGGRAARARTVRLRAAAVLDPRARNRDRGAAGLCPLWHGRDPVEPAGRRLALGQVPQGSRRRQATVRRGSRPATTSRSPGTSRSSRPSSASRFWRSRPE